MLSADEHSGVFSFLVGLVVLVMAGVGLSLLADRKFKFSSEVNALQEEISVNTLELEELEATKSERAALLATSGDRLRLAAESHKEVVADLAILRQRQLAIEASRRENLDQIETAKSGFATYREAYRRKVWAGAVGEKLGDLVLGSDRRYQQATIARVTEVGLEIRHDHGVARIAAADLDPKLQERFQWSAGELAKPVRNEPGDQEVKIEKPAAAGVGVGNPPAANDPHESQASMPTDAAKLTALRQKVTAWQLKVGQLGNDKRVADSQARSGSRKSVPGSLETWSAKSARLGIELTRARMALATARSDLAAVAPDDPLLRLVEDGF